MKKIKTYIWDVLIFLPFLLHTAVFTFYPAINTFVLSFKEDYRLLSDKYSEIGVGNYTELFQDKYFAQSIRNTLIYTALVVPIVLILSIVIANLLNQKIKFVSAFQTAFFLPMVTATTAVAYSWRLIFNSQYGVLNRLLDALGMPAVAWLTDARYSMAVVVVCGIWNMLPFSILTLLSALQSINKEYYTAAEIDGAAKMLVFRKITFPAISKSILLLGILHTISAFRVFDELFPLFAGKPGPGYNMYTLVYYMYEQMQSLSVGAYGKAAAAAVVLFVMLLGLSIVLFLLRMPKKAKEVK